MPRRPKNPHRAALTRMFRATGLIHMPEEAPLVELLRFLADEMDAGGGTRTRADYLSALKDVRRVLNFSGGRPHGSADTPPATAKAEPTPPVVATPNDLALFKQKRNIA